MPTTAQTRPKLHKPRPRPAPARRPTWIVFPALLAASLLAYWPALRGAFVWDDDAHITAPALRSLHGLWRIWTDLGATQQYYPLLHSAFWIEHRLWGSHVVGYHLANVFLHALAACLVVLIVRRLALPGAWLAGLIFALHPVAVESVAWISEQKSTLSAVFYLAAALAYLRYDESRDRKHYLWASALFLCALLSKSVTASLPAALLVIFWWKRGRLRLRRDVRPLAPWFALGIAAGLFTAWVEHTYIGAQGANFALSILQRFLLAGRVVCFYAAKLFWPKTLIFTYPRWTIDPTDWRQWLFPLGVLAVSVFVVGQARSLRRPRRSPLAALSYFLITLFPVLGFLNVYPFVFSYVADHFQYLAALGLIIPLSALIAPALDRLGPPANVALPAVLLTILAILTFRQSATYRNSETLYRATLARNPQSWMAHNNLGVDLLARGKTREAIAEYLAALRIKPDDAAAHNNLGNALARNSAHLPQAIAEFQTALRIEPNMAQAHQNLGNALAQVPGHIAEALAQFQAALRLKPYLPNIHNDLGVVLIEQPNRLPDAIAAFRSALSIDPSYAQAHVNLGSALARIPERRDEALAEFQAALKLDPRDPQVHDSLGAALAQMPGRLPDAIKEFQTAAELQPDFAEAHNNLGRALSQLPGRMPDALAEYRMALRLRPDYSQAQINLEAALHGNHP